MQYFFHQDFFSIFIILNLQDFSIFISAGWLENNLFSDSWSGLVYDSISMSCV
jgi:hypothetical protein